MKLTAQDLQAIASFNKIVMNNEAMKRKLYDNPDIVGDYPYLPPVITDILFETGQG